MRTLRSLATAAAVALAMAGPAVQADYWGDYANAQLGESLRASRSASFWTDMVARPSRNGDASPSGARTWVAENENPWANTYGTPVAEPLARHEDAAVLPGRGAHVLVLPAGGCALVGRRSPHRRRRHAALPRPVLLTDAVLPG